MTDNSESVPNDLPFEGEGEKPEPPAPPTPPTPALTIIVVGSYAWTNKGTVSDALVDLWESHGQPPIQLLTSGCPLGAELIARDLALGFGWEVVTVRDEELVNIPNAIACVFIKDGSRVASKLAADLERKMWTRVHSEYTVRQVTEWSNR